VLVLLAGLSVLPGCQSSRVVDRTTVFRATAAGGGAPAVLLDRGEMIRRCRSARFAARWDEVDGCPDCVDEYYAAAVFAYAAAASGCDPCAPAFPDDDCARNLYNTSLGDCLRAARTFGRLDARCGLTINTPRGSIVVPVTRHGFVWSTSDFGGLVDPRDVGRNPAQYTPHVRRGFGATEVVVRPNPKCAPADRFLPPWAFFPATAVLRPDVTAWLGGPPAPAGQDVVELYDPLRVPVVALGGRQVPLAADLDAPIAMAEKAVNSRRYTWTGFLNPSKELGVAALALVEPYQSGKVPVVFIHGLLDNPYVFTDMANELRSRPGFLDHFQIAVFRYPTGNTFLRSAALLRKDLRALETTFDPQHCDPGLQRTVLVGYSMGGLLSKLQITTSGDQIWALAANRPIDALVAPESTKALLRDIFYFEPLPFVRRVVFLATPHNGSALATRMIGRLGSRLVQRPADAQMIANQLLRDNPGAMTSYVARLPSSIDLLAVGDPLLETMQRLPINPATTYHVIAGTAYLPPGLARDDGVVPLSSAHVDGAASELWVPAIHTNIYRVPETIEEIDRILRLHVSEPTSRSWRPAGG
jgi:pimeloyl-ACP methyl ester carboxylesterase